MYSEELSTYNMPTGLWSPFIHHPELINHVLLPSSSHNISYLYHLMAEAIPFGIVLEILKKLGSLISNETSLISDVRDEARKLHSTLSAIHARLLDADEKKEGSHLIQDWIGKLNDVVYEADDVLDLIAGKDLCRHHSRFRDKVIEFFSSDNSLVFNYKVGHKIKEIRNRLDEIATDMSQFHFIERTCDRGTIKVRSRDETHSFVLESKTFGRGQNKKDIIDLLMRVDSQENVSIVAIVGMGGLGKTTLAQLVYNDNMVENQFDQRMWVCVSDDFNVKLLVRKIIQEATKTDPGDLTTMNQLQELLRKTIDEKKYLLVLDDNWNEIPREWEMLLDLLVGGAKGSKILVTTRSTKVASTMGVMSPYFLKELSEDDCWNLFKKLAFGEESERVHPNLMAMAKDIVKKCKGVPLAVKTLGNMFWGTTDETQWSSILNSELWELPQDGNGILPALKLSYDQLPIYLKECFAYCCLFPKDHHIKKDMLVKLWMAQGYLQSSNGDQTLEAVGDQYCKELLSRSLLEKVDLVEYECGPTFIKLHDLVHDLARSVINRRVHPVDKVPSQIIDPKLIRTLIKMEHNSSSWSNKKEPNFLLRKFSGLYALHIDYGFTLRKLPNSLGSLIHLRYLNLSHSDIRKLPSSISNLCHLLTLDLTYCTKLGELPKDIWKLVSLRHLMIEGCHNLTSVPSGLAKLTSLRTLDVFKVGRCTLSGLNNLIYLSGKLCIKDLGNARSDGSKLDVMILEGKKYLQSLELDWCVSGNNKDYNKRDEMLMKCLQLPPNLKELRVTSFSGVRLPIGMINDDSSSSLPNLVKIVIDYAPQLHHLPAFHQLPCLKILHLKYLYSLEYIYDTSGMPLSLLPMNNTSNLEIKGKIKTFFPSLKELGLSSLPRLKGWWNEVKAEGTSSMEEDQSQQLMVPAFPCLTTLQICDCPSLSSLPLHPSLERLTLYEVNDSLVDKDGMQFRGLKNLRSLIIPRNQELAYFLEALQHVTTIQDIKLDYCESPFIPSHQSIEDSFIMGCHSRGAGRQRVHGVLRQLLTNTSKNNDGEDSSAFLTSVLTVDDINSTGTLYTGKRSPTIHS